MCMISGSRSFPSSILTLPFSKAYEFENSSPPMDNCQRKPISGRYRTEYLCRHWSRNREGYCLSPSCQEEQIPETIEHILVDCGGYAQLRNESTFLWHRTSHPIVQSLATEALGSSRNDLIQFFLDCSVLPQIIMTTQCFGSVILEGFFI